MKYVSVDELEPSMITAEAIFDTHGAIELLKIGTSITDRHIKLLTNVGISIIPIFEEGDPDYDKFVLESKEQDEKPYTINTEYLPEDLIKDLEEIEDSRELYYQASTSVYNRNLEIHVLTGEADKPIDVQYEKEIMNVKDIFMRAKDAEQVDVKNVIDNVKKMLPAMINNNDVMMRLKQLKDTDDYLFDHSLRVAILAVNVAKWLGYSKGDLENLGAACLLYEVGNLKLPADLFKKEGTLTEHEKGLIMKHPQLAYHVLMKTKGINSDIKFVALQHHERLDGSGYPLKIKSPQIHEFSKIVMVCDIFDAMTQDRPYRKKLSPFEAGEYILYESGKSLDMKVCYFFLKNISEFYTGKTCILNSGEKAKVVFVDVNYPTRPIIQIGDKFVDLSKNSDYKMIDFI